MGPTPRVPIELTHGPFDLEEARRHGVSKAQLLGRSWRRVGVALYVWSEIADEPIVQLIAAKRRVPDTAVFTGATAAWLHGLQTKLRNPIEVAVPKTDHIWRRGGMAVCRCTISPTDTTMCRGLIVTSAIRTVCDLGCRLPLIDGVAVIDMATHRRLVSTKQLHDWVGAHAGYRGIRHLKRALELAEPATESVMETRLRLLLVLAGLPRPKPQFPLRDEFGILIARPDLYYPGARLAIEYDGATHRDSLAADNRRQNRLIDAGYRILRFTAEDVLKTPAVVVSIVRRLLPETPYRCAA